MLCNVQKKVRAAIPTPAEKICKYVNILFKYAEALPTRKEEPFIVVIFLLKFIIPQFGLSVGINRISGAPFYTHSDPTSVYMIGINWKPNMPWSEKINATIKEKLTKPTQWSLNDISLG